MTTGKGIARGVAPDPEARAVRDDRAVRGDRPVPDDRDVPPDPGDPRPDEAGLLPALQITGRSPVAHPLGGLTPVSDGDAKHTRRMTRDAVSGSGAVRTRAGVARALNGPAARAGRRRGARVRRRGPRARTAAARRPATEIARAPRSRATEIAPGPRCRANHGRTRHGALGPRVDRSVVRPPATSRHGTTRLTVPARIGDRPTAPTGGLRSAPTVARFRVPRLRMRSSSPQEKSWSPVAVPSRRRSRLGDPQSASW